MYESRLSSLSSFNSEQIRLIERVHLDFVRAGAKFDAKAQAKYTNLIQKYINNPHIDLQAVQSEMAAALAAERCSTYMHPGINQLSVIINQFSIQFNSIQIDYLSICICINLFHLNNIHRIV